MPLSLGLEKDIQDYEISQDELKANPPVFNPITGAFIGALSNILTAGAVMSIVLIFLASIIVYLIEKFQNSRITSFSNKKFELLM